MLAIRLLLGVSAASALSLHARPLAAPRAALLSRTAPITLELEAELSAAEVAAEQAKEILRSYNETVDNFPQPLPAPPKLLRALVPGAAGLDKGHQLALIIGRPATADYPTVLSVLQLGVKRVAVPKFHWINRLHVVMTIK